jgi:hypothetical protein
MGYPGHWGGGIGVGCCPLRPEMPLLTELENLFWAGGYKYFAPTALPAISSTSQRVGYGFG